MKADSRKAGPTSTRLFPPAPCCSLPCPALLQPLWPSRRFLASCFSWFACQFAPGHCTPVRLGLVPSPGVLPVHRATRRACHEKARSGHPDPARARNSRRDGEFSGGFDMRWRLGALFVEPVIDCSAAQQARLKPSPHPAAVFVGWSRWRVFGSPLFPARRRLPYCFDNNASTSSANSACAAPLNAPAGNLRATRS